MPLKTRLVAAAISAVIATSSFALSAPAFAASPATMKAPVSANEVHFGTVKIDGLNIAYREAGDPNALCPVCGASVFYYQNSSGSRVFFDNLGWPWSKHPCTDNPASQAGEIKRPNKTGRSVRVASANQTTLYELVDCNESCGLFSAKFRNIASPLITYTLRLPVSDFQSQGWTEDDLRDAPSFIIKLHPDQTMV